MNREDTPHRTEDGLLLSQQGRVSTYMRANIEKLNRSMIFSGAPTPTEFKKLLQRYITDIEILEKEKVIKE
jgi:hypothetical protein